MAKSYNKRVLYVNPDAGNCNWDIDWFRNHSMNAALLPPILDGNFVYSGVVPSAGAGLLVDLTSGFAKVDGTKFTIAAQSATVVGASLEAEEINFIYVDDAGAIIVTQIEPQETCALIAIVDTDTTSVLRITDGRKMQVAHDASYEKENDCINGSMQIWQRGNVGSITGYTCLDRFRFSSTISTYAAQRGDFAAGQTDVPGNPIYYLKDTVTSGNTAASYHQIAYRLLDVTKYSGKRIALSFWAQSDSSGLSIGLEAGQNFGSGGSATLFNVDSEKVDITTSWAKYIVFLDFPSVSGKTIGTLSKSEIGFWFDAGTDFADRSSNIGNQSGIFRIAEMEIYESDIELPIRRRTESEELLLCQAYFNSVSGNVFNSGSRFLFPITTANAVHLGCYSFPVRMTQTPTIAGASGMTLTNCVVPVVTATGDAASLKVNATLANSYTNAYSGTITFDAEL